MKRIKGRKPITTVFRFTRNRRDFRLYGRREAEAVKTKAWVYKRGSETLRTLVYGINWNCCRSSRGRKLGVPQSAQLVDGHSGGDFSA